MTNSFPLMDLEDLPMSLDLIGKRLSLVEEVMVRLRDSIETQRLRAGERLPTEQVLISQLGVSRTVLREAFNRLEATGLVSIQRGRGTFVAETSAVVNCAKLMRTSVAIGQHDLEDIVELRTALECQAARRAAARVTKEELGELQSILNRMGDDKNSRDEVMNFDHQLHERIAQIADSELIRTHLATIREFIMSAILDLPPPSEGVATINRRMHDPILEAFHNHDPEAADRALRGHMQILGERLCGPSSVSNST